MSVFSVTGLGSVGLNTDLAPWQLPPNAWSAMQNMRCAEGQIGTFSGHDEFSTPTVTPYWLLPVAYGSAYHWIYAGLAKVYTYNGATHTDITRAAGGDYTGGATDRWNGGVLNGVPILNNGKDDPQMWMPPTTGTDLVLLTAWDTDEKAKVIRPYKNYLVALNITKTADNYPHLVKTSNGAEPGTVPTTWDETDATKDAGEYPLSDSNGFLIDALQLRDELILYTENGAHGMQWIGGNDVFRFRRIDLPGMFAQNCAVEFKGGHLVVGDGDVYVHDGQNYNSVIDDKNRDLLFADIDPDNYESMYVAIHHAQTEIWICYPTSGKTLPNKAMIWNYVDNTWTLRALPTDTAYITNGIVTSSAYTWDTLPYATWADWPGVWGSRTYSPVEDSLIGASDTLYQFNTGNQFNSVNAVCYAERSGLNIGAMDDINTITRIYPHVEGDSVDIYVGSQMTPNAPVTWEGPYTYNPSTDYKVDCRVTGRLHGIRFQSEADVNWTVDGYDVELQPAGLR